jgi:predicted patatin/cPLA2 family phospholipase
VKDTGFKFDQLKEAINEAVKNFTQIQQEIKKWEEKQDIYNHEVWIFEDFIRRKIFFILSWNCMGVKNN